MRLETTSRRTGNTGDGLLAGKIGDMDKSVVEGGIDVRNAENELALSDLGTEGGGLRLGGNLLDLGGLHPDMHQ